MNRTYQATRHFRLLFLLKLALPPCIALAGCATKPGMDELAGQQLPERSGMTVTAGLCEWQVIQRNPDGFGTIACEGTSTREGRVWSRVLQHTRPVGGLGWHLVGTARDGRWSAEVQSIPTGGPYSLAFRVGEPDPDDYGARVDNIVIGDLWILAGQSNMQGRGRMDGAEPPSPLVRTYGMNEKWELAREPLHWLSESIDPVHYRSANKQQRLDAQRGVRPPVSRGAGLGLPFAKALSSATQVPIGVVPCAHGGTSIQQWDPALKDRGGKSLYGSMFRRFQAVGGRVRGVLWYQGEAQTRGDMEAVRGYDQKMKAFIQAVRRDVRDPDLPFYMVQLARTVKDRPPEAWTRIRQMQRLLSRQMTGVVAVSSIDLDLDDRIHVGTPGLKRLGQRLAKVAEHELFGNAQLTQGPRLESVTLAGDRRSALRVRFTDVNGRLRPDCHIAGFSLRDDAGREIADFFEVMVDPEDTSSVLCLLGEPVPPDANLYYGYGLNPYCNLTDAEDMAVLAFGPIPIQPAAP
jgi:sialate O-acetylesterase